MRDLVAQLIDNRLSRRGFFKSMAAAGFSAAAIEGIIGEIEAAELPAGGSAGKARTVTGNGGQLWVEQMEASGVEYLFTNPGSTETGFFDAFIDKPNMQLINMLLCFLNQFHMRNLSCKHSEGLSEKCALVNSFPHQVLKIFMQTS